MRWVPVHAALIFGLAGCPTGGAGDGGLGDGTAPADATPSDAAGLDGGADAARGPDAAPADAAPVDAAPADARVVDAAPGDGGAQADAAPGDGSAPDDAAADQGADACPAAAELCNGLDDDCDGRVDEACPEPGELDPTFGTAGVFEGALGLSTEVRDLHVDATGRVWLAGGVRGAAGWDMLAARLTPGGVLDQGFAGTGWLGIDFAGGTDLAYGLDVNADSSMVLAGFRTESAANPALAQVTEAGALDPGFSGGRISPAGLDSGTYRGVAYRGGGLLTVGETRAVGGLATELVTHHRADGTVEAGGLLALEHPADVRVRGAAVAPDGTVAFVGHVEAGTDDDAFLAVLPPEGMPALHVFDADDQGASRDRFLGIQATPDGFLVVGESDGDQYLGHLSAAGEGVAGLRAEGLVLRDFGGGRQRLHDAATQADGALLVVGSAELNGVTRFLVSRFTPAGHWDETFGEDGSGIVLLDFGHPDEDAEAHTIELTPDGRFAVVGGAAGPHGQRRAVVVRLGL